MNNNNFGRNNIPSNLNQNYGQSGNLSGNFNPLSTNNPMFPTYNNVIDSYKQNTPLIQRPDYKNQNNLLHNNVGDNVLNEEIIKYRINLDSTDRDPKYFKDPFKYTVTFYPNNSTPRPIINKEFTNIKYIKLDSVILPRYTYIEKIDGDYTSNTSSESHIFDDRFVLLNIEQLEGVESRVYGTNTHLSNSFAQLIPDKLISTSHYNSIYYLGSRYFKDSGLQNLNKLTIKFLDSNGNPLKIKRVDENGDKINIKDTDPLATKQDDGTYKDSDGNVISITDIRHPLNKKHQNHISLTFGIVEADINKNTQYARY